MRTSNTNANNSHLMIDYHQHSSSATEEETGRLTKNINNICSSHIRLGECAKNSKQRLENKNASILAQLKKVSNERINGVIYSPFYNEDMVIQTIGINSARIIKGKHPFPVICAQEKSGVLKSSIEDFKEKESIGRLSAAEQYDKIITSKIESINGEFGSNRLNLREMFNHHPREVKIVGEHRAIKQLEITKPNLLKDNNIDVVYVIGHGESGRPHFFETTDQTSRSKTVSEAMSEMSKLLAGKINSSTKIKVTSCESADRETIDSVHNIPKGISEKKSGVAPLALTVKEEVSKYFPEARVFGYHGLGITRGYQYIGETRCAKSDFDDLTGNVSKFIKASLVRKEF